MAFVHFSKNSKFVNAQGKEFYVVGVNYVASYACTNFWENFQAETVYRDLKNISEMGLNAVRIPMFWGYMEPERGIFNEDFYSHFEQFTLWCEELELYIMPWFLVGTATKDYDVSYRQGKLSVPAQKKMSL